LDGENLSDYEVHEQLGAGGMGAVYRATDRRIGRTVAIKVIRPDRLVDETVRERFIREARGIGQLNHPNIATLYDVSLDGATPHIVMEYLPGGSLEQRIRRGPMPLGELLRCAADIGLGLEHAHAHGVVHRDLKPGNILFSAGGIPKIIDFGLASTADLTALTQPGTVMGTAEYMSPEQASGKPADHRSDLFSYGVILYQMASGRNPFQSGSVPATLHRIVYDAPPPVSAVRPDLPAAFTRMVAALLEKRPENRPQSLRGAIGELQSLRQSTSAGARDSTQTMVAHAGMPKWRRLARPGLAILLLTVLLGGVWWARSRWMAPRLPAVSQLVVLPFENLSHDPMEQAFCDGLVELVTSTLTQMERFHSTLWVIPSADVRRLDLHSVSEARKAFPVNLAVTGSLQTDGDRVLVIANLSDVKTTRQIGSRMIPVSRPERSQLTARLASALLELLDLNADNSGREVLRGVQPKVSSANDSYVQAKGLMQHAEVPANLNKAIELLEQSVKLDATFALSHASLGNGWVDDPDVVPVPLDPDFTSAAHPSKGFISWVDPSTEMDIQLDPAAMSADATGSGGVAMVTWQWGPDQPDTKPFTLEFLHPVNPVPAGWPKLPTASTNVNPSIILFLPKGSPTATPFRITTTKEDGNDTSQDGTLLIA